MEQEKPNQPTAVDWSEVHHRMATARMVIERGLTLSLEEKKQILKARAKELARAPGMDEAAQGSIEVVEFFLAYEQYGIESAYVREVYPLTEFTPLPCTPPFVLGIINVRGQILSVINLKKFFDLPDKGLTDLNKVIIVRLNDVELGLLADAILGVRSIPLDEIQPSLPTLTDRRAEYLRGVTKERLVILDVARVLSDHRIIVHEEVEM
jgi:purine-binding chemotaxis protein CheW